jgi:hypothetical protein
MLSVSAHAVNINTCDINNGTDVLNCAIENHPDVLRLKGRITSAQINQELSYRRPTPDLDVSLNYNDQPDQQGLNGDLAFMQTFETKERKAARVTRASSKLLYQNVALKQTKEESAFYILTYLNRLRQIDKEKSIVAEAIKTFGDIITRYKNRPILPPEEAVSLDVFKSAMKNYQLESSKLFSEEKSIINALKNATDNRVDKNKNILLYAPKSWPQVDSDIKPENSSAALMETVGRTEAQADYLEAKSASFGSIKLGPYIESRPSDITPFNAVGIKASLPIALYSNKKALELAGVNQNNANLSYELKKAELKNNFERLKETYSFGVSALTEYDISAIENTHLKSEKLFAGGRVSGSMFIESHRQLLESIKIYHQYEMETLQSLWNIYILQDKIISNITELYDE